MALIVETGAGIQSAESYGSTAGADAYWSARPHLALSTTWAAATTGNKEGALRESTAYIEATWGNFYRGDRRGYLQGLEWPRTDANDDSGYPLPDLPPILATATYELAARALSAPLASDLERGGKIKTLKAGSVQIDYEAGANADPRYGIVANILAPILNGSQPDAPNPKWTWA